MLKKITIILLIITFIIFLFLFPKNDTEQDINYVFYKEENYERYLKYQDDKKNLSFEEVIIRVNLNLDKPFYTNTTPSKYLNTTYLLVNKYNYLKKDYVPNNLVILDDCYSKEIYLVKEARDNFIRMCHDIGDNNLTIRAISGYRSYAYQENLYNNYVKKDGVKIADTYSARPGFSEHQTGLVVDIDNNHLSYENFDKTNEFVWLKDNAYKYGFILRYPEKKESITGYSYESWHYRYVGLDISKYIHDNNITFDEYYIKFIDY